MIPNYISLDIESGGFSAEKNPITEVGSVVVDGKTLKIVNGSDLQFYVKPYNNLVIKQSALDATMVTMQDVLNGEDGEITWQLLKEYFIEFKVKGGKGNNGLPVMCGHNIGFDIDFLVYLFKFYKDNYYKYIQPIPFCTYKFGIAAYGHKGVKLKLGNLCEYMGITLTDAHSAYNDAYATAKVLINFLQRLRASQTVNKGVDVEEANLLEFKF